MWRMCCPPSSRRGRPRRSGRCSRRTRSPPTAPGRGSPWSEPPAIRRQAALGWLAAEPAAAVPTVAGLLGDDRDFWRSVVTQAGVGPRLAAELRERKLPAEAAKVGLTVVRSAGGRTAELEKV